MKRLFLFRTNLKNLEYYHDYKDLETFKLKCHDFYLLQCILFLENNIFDEVIIWRLSDNKINDIVFNINNKKFIQRWVKDLKEVFKYEKSDVSFFRGGFEEYCEVTKINPNFFGLKLYLGAGPRVFARFGGVYDKYLIEDEADNLKSNCFPFYKTTNPNIFKPLNLEIEYDMCLIANIKQPRKGMDFIFNEISKSNFLRSLKICHIGEFKESGIEICKKLNIKNIEFLGLLEKDKVNEVLNKSKCGVVASNKLDGCPRVLTEILTSGTPLLVRDQTRLLNYYKQYGVIEFKDLSFLEKSHEILEKFKSLKVELLTNYDIFSTKKICEMNLNEWQK